MTDMLRFAGRAVLALVCAAAFVSWMPEAARAAAQPPPDQQEQFVPIDELPPEEQLAAAPLLVGAYAFVLVVLFVYLYSLSRRLTAVQREVERLETDLRRTGRT